jgi:glutamine synthetase
MTASVMKMIKDKEVKFVDLRFTDTRGKEQHVSMPASVIDEDFFTDGKMFDGSSIAGWKGIQESDMVLMPEADTAVMDPFADENTLIIRCDILEPATMQGYERDPRSLAKRAEAYLKSTGIADTAYFGPEPEFFILDDVRWGADMQRLLLQDRLRRGRLELRARLRGRQHGPPPLRQGRLLPGAAGRLPERPARRHVPRHGGDGRPRRGASPRGGDRRPVRDRHPVRHPGRVPT